ncbi:hypothetical protein [Pengzhenrongella sp.]|uniref:hypothetical protein n=1 Tax=Pengzhenrongella sp. TaxID=2888820 RepID=UPI002F91EDE8
MSSTESKTRQPKGVPVGGQFATETRTEPDGVDLAAGAGGVRMGGLLLEGDFTDGGRELAEMVSRSGVCGSVSDHSNGDSAWSRLQVVLATGDELRVAVATKHDEDAPPRMTSVAAHFYAGEDNSPNLGDFDDERYGSGGFSEIDVREAVRHTLLRVAAGAAFYERFPETPGLAMEWIGEESVGSRWAYPKGDQPQQTTASFKLDGTVDAGVTCVSDGTVELDVDNLTLDYRRAHLLEVSCADLNRRLGVTPADGQTHEQSLSATLTGVTDQARSHPVWADNIDQTKAGLP